MPVNRFIKMILYFSLAVVIFIVASILRESCGNSSAENILWDVIFVSPALLVSLAFAVAQRPLGVCASVIFVSVMMVLSPNANCETTGGGSSMVEVIWLFCSLPIALISGLGYLLLRKLIVNSSAH